MGKFNIDPIVVGYKYFLGVQLAICHGPVDSVNEIQVGERVAYSGSSTYPTASTIAIDKPELFGGEDREGGVKGTVDIMWGSPTQGRNSYLAAHQGATCPAYRGVFGLLFKSFYWSAINPYFKSPAVTVRRILKGWQDDVCWYSGKAVIEASDGVPDMNPAHIIYQCFTDSEWGMGYAPSDMGASFVSVANTLFSEQFGLSLIWDQQTDIETFVKLVLDHIDGTVRLDMRTGKFEITLNRGDYAVEDLTVLNPSNVLAMKSFQRATYGEFANEVIVVYTDRKQKDKSLSVQNLASVQAQQAVVPTTRNYPGVRTYRLASRLAARDLRMLSTPLAKASLTTNRVLFDKVEGDVVALTWPERGVNKLPMRIVKIDKGSLTNGKIEVELVEDVFGLPLDSYVEEQASLWEDTLKAPAAVEAAKAVEASYWDVLKNMRTADMQALGPDYGFGVVLAARGATNAPMKLKLAAAASSGGTYKVVGSGHFVPTGILIDGLTKTQTLFALTGHYDLSEVRLDASNGYLMVDNECMAVVSADENTGQVTVRRGVLDTVPATHAAGARVFFVNQGFAVDPTERVSGEVTYYKPLTVTGVGTLPLSSATAVSLTFADRAGRPYPPGQFKVNAAYWPAAISGVLTVTWVGRNRLQQTVSLVDYSQGHYTPEVGTTYTVRVYDGNTNALLRTYSAVSSGWTYPASDDIADGLKQTLRLTLTSVVSGAESLQPHDHTFERYGLGFRLGDSLGGTLPA